jgi:hypothetical protein
MSHFLCVCFQVSEWESKFNSPVIFNLHICHFMPLSSRWHATNFGIRRFQFSCFNFCDYSSMSWNAGILWISFPKQVKIWFICVRVLFLKAYENEHLIITGTSVMPIENSTESLICMKTIHCEHMQPGRHTLYWLLYISFESGYICYQVMYQGYLTINTICQTLRISTSLLAQIIIPQTAFCIKALCLNSVWINYKCKAVERIVTMYMKFGIICSIFIYVTSSWTSLWKIYIILAQMFVE